MQILCLVIKLLVVVSERIRNCGIENLKEEMIVVNIAERESAGFGDILNIRA